MKISQQGIDLIKKWEGFRSEAYRCSAGIPTIGFGSVRINSRPVRMGEVCTREQAEEWLKKDVEYFESVVDDAVNSQINQAQFDALVSFTYNVGAQAFRDSTLLRKLNAADYVGAAAEFLRWDKAAGRSVEGLRNRRKDEKRLFESSGVAKVSESMKMPATDQLDYLMDGHASLPIAELPKAAAMQLQELLNCVGYSLTVDGVIGAASKKAFGSWKASADQGQPDVIGKGSLGILKEEAEQRIEGTAQPEAVIVQYMGREFHFPTVGMVKTDQPIIPAGSFSFGEATHNGVRIPTEAHAKNIIKMAKLMQPYRERVGKAWQITSWYRPEPWNSRAYGASNSQHLYGLGVDIAMQGEDGRSMLNLFGRDWYDAGIGGVGIYPGVRGIIHLDCRGVRAKWGW